MPAHTSAEPPASLPPAKRPSGSRWGQPMAPSDISMATVPHAASLPLLPPPTNPSLQPLAPVPSASSSQPVHTPVQQPWGIPAQSAFQMPGPHAASLPIPGKSRDGPPSGIVRPDMAAEGAVNGGRGSVTAAEGPGDNKQTTKGQQKQPSMEEAMAKAREIAAKFMESAARDFTLNLSGSQPPSSSPPPPIPPRKLAPAVPHPAALTSTAPSSVRFDCYAILLRV